MDVADIDLASDCLRIFGAVKRRAMQQRREAKELRATRRELVLDARRRRGIGIRGQRVWRNPDTGEYTPAPWSAAEHSAFKDRSHEFRLLSKAADDEADRFDEVASKAAYWLEQRTGVDRRHFLSQNTTSDFPPSDGGLAQRAFDEMNKNGKGADLLAWIWTHFPIEAGELQFPSPSPSDNRIAPVTGATNANALAEPKRSESGKKLRRRQGSKKMRPLTAKQVETMQIVGECKGSFAEAARRLGKDRKTVEECYKKASEKIGVTSIKHSTLRIQSDQRGQADLTYDDERRG